MRACSSGQTRVVAVTSLVLCRRGFCVAVRVSSLSRPLLRSRPTPRSGLRLLVVFAGGEQRAGGVFS